MLFNLSPLFKTLSQRGDKNQLPATQSETDGKRQRERERMAALAFEVLMQLLQLWWS